MSPKIMTVANPKLLKSGKKGWLNIGLTLAPHTASGVNVCSHASPVCASDCLNLSGRGVFKKSQLARKRRTDLLFSNSAEFWHLVRYDIERAKEENNKLCVRMNVLSDLPWERMKVHGTKKSVMELYPDIQFYDYTKVPGRKVPKNYDLTFSLSEENDRLAMEEVWEHKRNLAVVMRTKKQKYYGIRCIDGDKNDLRFIDPWPRIVRLSPKGRMRKDTGGFVR